MDRVCCGKQTKACDVFTRAGVKMIRHRLLSTVVVGTVLSVPLMVWAIGNSAHDLRNNLGGRAANGYGRAKLHHGHGHGHGSHNGIELSPRSVANHLYKEGLISRSYQRKVIKTFDRLLEANTRPLSGRIAFEPINLAAFHKLRKLESPKKRARGRQEKAIDQFTHVPRPNRTEGTVLITKKTTTQVINALYHLGLAVEAVNYEIAAFKEHKVPPTYLATVAAGLKAHAAYARLPHVKNAPVGKVLSAKQRKKLATLVLEMPGELKDGRVSFKEEGGERFGLQGFWGGFVKTIDDVVKGFVTDPPPKHASASHSL